MKNKPILILAIAVSMLISCRKNTEPVQPGTAGSVPADTASGVLVAERIIQDIIIKNNDSNDAWADECLKGMHRETLVNETFEMAYSGKAKVYDFDTHEILSKKQLKEREKKEGFSRDKIGKIQFIESWYLNPDKVTFTKKVNSLVLGYETYDSQGHFRGYLPVFRMVFNPDAPTR
jgi:hypothetical protein